MANAFMSLLRSSPRFLGGSAMRLTQIQHVIAPALSRSLYSKETLGIDGFMEQRQQIKHSMREVLPSYIEKMQKYCEDDTSMIYTEDLKNFTHVAQSDSEIDILIKMMKKFNQQNKQMRFGSFIFGPVVMRLFHHENKPEKALECFNAPELNGFFDQLITYQILLDLLYENQMYDEVLKTFDVIRERQLEGMRNPKNAIVLVMAACYKLNSEESLKYAAKLWRNLQETGHLPMRRAATFFAGLALNQGRYGEAMEIVSAVNNSQYTTVRNIKVYCLAAMGRVEDTIPILKYVLSNDQSSAPPHTFNKDVMDRVRAEITRVNDPALTLEFDKIDQLFMKQGHIADTTLDEQLCCEIARPPVMNNRQQHFGQYNRYDQRQNNQRRYGDHGERRYQTNQRYQGRNIRERNFRRPELADLD